MTFRLPDINTRFALPVICPTTGEEVSAETLYNRCCDALGHVVRHNIGDLIFDNFNYQAVGVAADVCATDESNAALHDAVYAWAASVYARLPEEPPEPPEPVDDGSCDPLYGQRMDSADLGEN